MGNHEAGRAMVHTATALRGATTQKTALEILDIACRPYAGCDAEFDDDAYPGEPFGDLITEAFNPDWREGFEKSDEGDEGEYWYQHVYFKFRTRYELC